MEKYYCDICEKEIVTVISGGKSKIPPVNNMKIHIVSEGCHKIFDFQSLCDNCGERLYNTIEEEVNYIKQYEK